jgi:hypothetical protein
MWEQKFKITSNDFADKTPEIEEAVLAAEDPIHELKRLAGLPNATNVYEGEGAVANRDGAMSTVGSNISVTGMEKQRLEKEHNIKPGTDEWFRLWFSRPYLTGEKPVDTVKKH